MNQELELFLRDSAEVLERELERHLPLSSLKGSERLNRAVYDAVFPGGKRMRPHFTLLAAHSTGGRWRDALPVACGVEYLHTCSLILDDLPCMDGAPERRGKEPTYLVFGESTAILAAVALLTRAWTLFLHNDFFSGGTAVGRRLLEEASRCIGPDGIIGGQFLDLSNEEPSPTSPDKFLKTAGTTRFMLSSGAIVAGAPPPAVEALSAFGHELGSIYQMLDDIIDMEADARTGALGQGALMLELACSRLKQATDRLLRSFDDGSVSLILEYTRWVFHPMIERARECMQFKTRDVGGCS